MRVLVTGATSGLGARTALAVAELGHLPVCAGRDQVRVAATAERLGGEAAVLDLGSRLSDLRSAVRELGPVDAVVVNAAVQHVRATRSTPDGVEETLAVNHLAHVLLVETLLSGARPPSRVVLVSSETHDGERWTGTPPPLDAPLSDLADPSSAAAGAGAGVGERELGMRRYVTSKQLLTAYAVALAAEPGAPFVAAYDPGVMPGTRLGRDQPAVVRAAWPVVSRCMLLLPFASTVSRSAASLASLACADPPPVPSGSYVDHRLRVRPPSRQVRDAGFRERVLAETRALVAELG